jgi:hypothetical protein
MLMETDRAGLLHTDKDSRTPRQGEIAAGLSAQLWHGTTALYLPINFAKAVLDTTQHFRQ